MYLFIGSTTRKNRAIKNKVFYSRFDTALFINASLISAPVSVPGFFLFINASLISAPVSVPGSFLALPLSRSLRYAFPLLLLRSLHDELLTARRRHYLRSYRHHLS